MLDKLDRDEDVLQLLKPLLLRLSYLLTVREMLCTKVWGIQPLDKLSLHLITEDDATLRGLPSFLREQTAWTPDAELPWEEQDEDVKNAWVNVVKAEVAISVSVHGPVTAEIKKTMWQSITSTPRRSQTLRVMLDVEAVSMSPGVNQSAFAKIVDDLRDLLTCFHEPRRRGKLVSVINEELESLAPADSLHALAVPAKSFLEAASRFVRMS
jgi:hypothetical protein